MLNYDNNIQGQNAAEREEARRDFIFSEIVKRQELLGQKRKKINGEIYELSLMENDVVENHCKEKFSRKYIIQMAFLSYISDKYRSSRV